MYTARTEDGVKVGELDEEFVYESQLGDRFLLGSFAWKIVSQDKDTVVVTQSGTEGARLPFWKGENQGTQPWDQPGIRKDHENIGRGGAQGNTDGGTGTSGT